MAGRDYSLSLGIEPTRDDLDRFIIELNRVLRRVSSDLETMEASTAESLEGLITETEVEDRLLEIGVVRQDASGELQPMQGEGVSAVTLVEGVGFGTVYAAVELQGAKDGLNKTFTIAQTIALDLNGVPLATLIWRRAMQLWTPTDPPPPGRWTMRVTAGAQEIILGEPPEAGDYLAFATLFAL